MGTSIVEQIAAELKTTLEGITAANGYDVEVPEVIRPVRTGVEVKPANYGIILMAGERMREEALCLMGNPPAVAWRQTFTADLYIRVSEAETTAIETLAHIFETAVVKALMVDRRRGGLAIDTELRGSDFMLPSDQYEGITAMFDVIYRVAENDPETRI